MLKRFPKLMNLDSRLLPNDLNQCIK